MNRRRFLGLLAGLPFVGLFGFIGRERVEMFTGEDFGFYVPAPWPEGVTVDKIRVKVMYDASGPHLSRVDWNE